MAATNVGGVAPLARVDAGAAGRAGAATGARGVGAVGAPRPLQYAAAATAASTTTAAAPPASAVRQAARKDAPARGAPGRLRVSPWTLRAARLTSAGVT